MKLKKKYKRNKQLGRTLLVLAAIIGITMALDIFEVHSVKIQIILLVILSGLLLFSLLEFVTPFAYLSANFVNIQESPLFVKRILKSHIREVKSYKGRFLVITCKTWRRRVIYLKSIHINDKLRFTRELQNIAKRNSMFDVVERMK